MSEVVIRDMHLEDCLEVSRVQCASFRWRAEREGYSREQIAAYFEQRGSEDAIRAQLQALRCLVACSKRTIVGVVGIKGNEISELFVDPSCLRQGIGTALFRAAEDLIVQAGHQDLFVGTAFPASVPFYRAMGMCESGRKTIDCGPLIGAQRLLLGKPLNGREDAEPLHAG